MPLRPTAKRRREPLLHPRYWLSWIGVGMLRLFSLLPVPVLWAGGVLVGELLYYLVPSRRRVVAVNIGMCFPNLSEGERRRLIKRNFHAFGQALLDIGIAWWARPARLRRLVRIRGREPVDALLAAGKRIIFMAPHFLGLEIGGVRISLEGQGCAMFRPLRNKVLNRVMEKGRTRFGLVLVAHKAPLTTLVRVMREGAPLFYLPDQDAHRRSRAFVPFFGIRTATFTTLSRFASLTDAVVVPLVCRQLPRGRGYEVVCRSPLSNFPSNDLLRDASTMNREIEQEVQEAPHQYFWMHRRFKTRPRGEASLYD